MDPKTIIDILLSADGGCPVCARELITLFAEAYPQYATMAHDAYEAEYGEKSPRYAGKMFTSDGWSKLIRDSFVKSLKEYGIKVGI